MAVSPSEFARELRSFSARGEVVNEVRRDIRKEVPPLRTEVRASALAILPKRNGFAAWVAKAGITVRYKSSGRSTGFSLKISRRAGDGDKADLLALDNTGSARHPLFGNRGHWYPQAVRPGFFTKVWNRRGSSMIATVDAAMDKALDKIRIGR